MAKKLPWSVSSDRIQELSQLVREEPVTVAPVRTVTVPGHVRQISINAIRENPYQPRKTMSAQALDDLAASLQTHGFLQPLVGTPTPEGDFILVAGHRRLAAARKNGLKTVPMIIREVADEELRVLGLIENLQREDLHPVEKARALFGLSETFATQQAAAAALGMNRPALAQWLRLREINDEILDVCGQVPDLTLRMLHRVLQLPEARRLAEARRYLATTTGAPDKKPTPAKEVTRKKVAFEYRQTEKRFSIAVEIKVKTKRGIVTKEDYREALRFALERLENENL
ncbi:MAG: ParB/RepB/Spo0J family partition protein [Blastocatellia bacterium]|nr:ParB/RepB/Spo0J family partition protein [Blastocatellia bacterium]